MSEKTPVERAKEAFEGRITATYTHDSWMVRIEEDAMQRALTAAVADREGLVRVLRAHQPKGGIRDMRIHCMCGWSTDRKGSRTDHVADAVARWLTGGGV